MAIDQIGDGQRAALVHLLIVDDSEDYAIAVVRELLRAGYHPAFRQVYEPEAIAAAFDQRPWDVILADYSMPHFRAATVLALLRQRRMNVPVVVVSADFGEDVAVAAMKAGANDFLLKDNVSRLVPTLERTIRDATARRQVEEAMRSTEERLRAVLASAPIVLWTLDHQGLFTLSEGKGLELLGLKPGEVVGQSVFELHRDSPPLLEHNRRALAGEADAARIEVAGRIFESRSLPLHDPKGKVAGVLGVAMDVTEQSRVQEALGEAESRYRQLVESIQAILWRADPATFRFTFVSPEAEKTLGYPVARWTSEPNFWTEHIHADDRNGVLALCRRASEEKRDQQFEYRMVGWDGRIVWLQDVVRVVVHAGHTRELVGVMIDITRRKLLEEELQQAQKMEAFGQLAGGVAHDFNNILSAILGHSDLLLKTMDPHGSQRTRVDEIQKAAERAASLTRQLLAFSRKQVLQPRVLDLNAIVTDFEKMLRRLIGEDIELLTVLEPRLGRVKADRSQVEQILMNLAVNARDAMPQGGKLVFKTANAELDEAYVRYRPGTRPGFFVALEVSDTGHGMDPSTLSRIFEPFFTTKGPGKGTGLGLATVYGIVQQSGGHISVYSEPGRGTTFKVYLPRVEGHAEAADDAPPAPAPRGSETVLLAEDEAFLREIMREVLEEAGYTVLEGETPEAALAIARAHGGTIHLAITDVIMPGMSGREMAAALATISPHAKILYVSGYTHEIIGHHGLLDANTHFLQKPFTTEALLRKVRELLDAPS